MGILLQPWTLLSFWGRDIFCFSHDRRKRGLQSRDANDTLDHLRNLRGDCDLRDIQTSTRPQLASIPVCNRSRAQHCALALRANHRPTFLDPSLCRYGAGEVSPTASAKLDLEPLVVHAVQEFGSDRIARSRANHGIDCASWTLGGLALVDPFRDLCWGKDRKAVKATAKGAGLQFHAMETAMLVSRLQAIFIRPARSQSMLSYFFQFTRSLLLRLNCQPYAQNPGSCPKPSWRRIGDKPTGTPNQPRCGSKSALG